MLYKAVNVCLKNTASKTKETDPTPALASGNEYDDPDLSPEEEEIPELPPPVGRESSGAQNLSAEGPSSGSQNLFAEGPSMLITEEEARMSVALTEYFQEQRKAYEQVCAC